MITDSVTVTGRTANAGVTVGEPESLPGTEPETRDCLGLQGPAAVEVRPAAAARAEPRP